MARQTLRHALTGLALALLAACHLQDSSPAGVDKLTYHYGPDRSGWNDNEATLTPEAVASEDFGLVWQSPQLDSFGAVPPRLFASPLYISALAFDKGSLAGETGPVAYVATTAGYAYAIAAAPFGGLESGEIIWRQRLTESPCANGEMGILATPVIDRTAGRIYVTACTGEDWLWHVHALDVQSGEPVPGWPLEVSHRTVTADLNANGTTSFVTGQPYIQRGALNLSTDGSSLYVAFGPDMQGWLLSIDTTAPRIASAFSSMPRVEMEQGGMWGSSGPMVDAQGRIHIATGASFANALANGGIAGVYPDEHHAWGQSILQFTDSSQEGLRLVGTYTPFNYCQTAAADIDIAGSGPIAIELSLEGGGGYRLLALGGGKQGNAYLLDRDHMPGDLVRRQACSTDAESDGSLLAPEIQPELGTRGPVSIFGPYSDDIGMGNSAKSRSTAAYFRDKAGNHFIYLTGASKAGPGYGSSVPPGLARVRILAESGASPFLRLEQREMTQLLQNPGSPVVSSSQGAGGIVWLLDPNVPRSINIYDPQAPGARLYAFDAQDLRLLWASGAELRTSGKYNEPAVVDGIVLVGTDRLQAYGMRNGKKLVAGTGDAQSASPGSETAATKAQALFTARCSSCHGNPATGAPDIAALAALPKHQVIDSLTKGPMQEMTIGLNPEEISTLANALPDLAGMEN